MMKVTIASSGLPTSKKEEGYIVLRDLTYGGVKSGLRCDVLSEITIVAPTRNRDIFRFTPLELESRFNLSYKPSTRIW